jgi:putative membrane protein
VTALLVPLGYGAAYMLLVRRRARAGGGVPRARVAAFVLGLLALGVALGPLLDGPADRGSLPAHMAQHELLLAVVPVLLALGLDARLMAPVTRAVVRPALRRTWSTRVLATLTHPALAAGAWAAVTLGWHIPAVLAAAREHPLLHAVAHVSLLGAGIALWVAVLDPLPSLHHRGGLAPRLWCLAAASAAGGTLAAVLLWSPDALYDGATLTGQRVAGALMMGVEMPLLLGAAAWLVVRSAARATVPLARRG